MRTTSKIENINTWLETLESSTITLPLCGGAEIEVKTSLSVDDIYAFVDQVVDCAFTTDGEYSAVSKDLAFKVTVLQMLTDCPIPKVEGTEHVDAAACARIVDALGLLDAEKMAGINEAYSDLICDLDGLVICQLAYEKEKRLVQMPSAADQAMQRIVDLCDELAAFLNGIAGESDRNADMLQKLIDSGLTPEALTQAALQAAKSKALPGKPRDQGGA